MRTLTRAWTLRAAAVAACTALFSWPIGWNGFALVYWDTAQYVTRFATGTPSLDRPMYYSIAVWMFTHLPGGMVLLAITQAAVTAALLLAVIEHSVPDSAVYIVLACAAALIAVSPNVFHVVTVMPDIATLWMVFGMVLASGRRTTVAALMAIVAALLVHNSNVVIFGFLAPLCLLIRFRPRFTAGAIAIFAVATAAANVAMQAPVLATAKNFFLAARMNQNDALLKSLGDCGTVRCRQWAGHLEPLLRQPESLLWDMASPLRRDFPAWDTDVVQFRAADAFLRPLVENGFRRYRSEFLATGKHNMGSLAAGEYMLLGYVSHAPQSDVGKALHGTSYGRSRQAQGDVPHLHFAPAAGAWRRIFYTIARLTALTALLSASWILISKFRKVAIAPPVGAIAVLTAAFVANIVVCGLLSSPQTRYVERVLALPIVASLIAVSHIKRFPRHVR